MGSARNRRKRERRLRKRHEQREYRRLTRAIEVAPKILRRPPDTRSPLPSRCSRGFRRARQIEADQGERLLGATVWNFLVTLEREFDRQGDAVEILEEQMRKILDALSLGTGLSADDALDLVQTLAGRKHDLFADERRLIGDVHAEFRGDRVHVVALSTLPL